MDDKHMDLVGIVMDIDEMKWTAHSGHPTIDVVVAHKGSELLEHVLIEVAP